MDQLGRTTSKCSRGLGAWIWFGISGYARSVPLRGRPSGRSGSVAWQHGRTERQGGWWKELAERTISHTSAS
eukprot:392147-Pyramimonas_sp.AAC.1